jgi:hypothetical protein
VARTRLSFHIKKKEREGEVFSRTDEALCHEDVWRSGCIDPRILDSTIFGELSASSIGRFIPKERTPRIHRTGGWVGPETGIKDVEGTKILAPYLDSNFDPSAAHLAATRYTDCAIPAPLSQ